MAEDKGSGAARGDSATSDLTPAGSDRAGGTDAFGESERGGIGPDVGSDSGTASGDFTGGVGGGVDGNKPDERHDR